jgi:hypothetical protein
MSRETSLTAPNDRTREAKFDSTVQPLNENQLSAAMSNLNVTSFVERFPQVERRFADPSVDNQKIGLISFVPAKGAKPNEHGVFGFAKLRGNFATEIEANERAEYLVRNVDSYHQIYHTYVGRPFPLTTSSDYSKEVTKVDLQKEMTTSISEDVKKKREKEQKDIEEIKNREKELLEDVKKAPEENKDDYYTTLRVKKAQLVWTYNETEKKLRQMAGSIAKARYEIEELDKTNPSLKETYYNRYMDARRQAGLSTEKVESDTSFMKFLVEDLHIQAVEDEYNRLYGSKN